MTLFNIFRINSWWITLGSSQESEEKLISPKIVFRSDQFTKVAILGMFVKKTNDIPNDGDSVNMSFSTYDASGNTAQIKLHMHWNWACIHGKLNVNLKWPWSRLMTLTANLSRCIKWFNWLKMFNMTVFKTLKKKTLIDLNTVLFTSHATHSYI